MDSERDFKGIWIPKEIWLSKELTVMEKLFLVEIDSLNNSKHGCFASNKYFSDFFELSIGRVSQIISSLKEKGFIEIEYEREGKQTVGRKIISCNKLNRYLENCITPLENDMNPFSFYTEGYLENDKENNININNTINNKNNNPNPSSWKNKTYFENTELNDLFLDFLDLRKKIKAVNSDRAINNLVNKLNKYDDETKKQMINNSITNSWKDVYEIKGTKPIQAQEEEDPIVREEIYDGVVYGITKKGDRISLRLVNDPRLQNN